MSDKLTDSIDKTLNDKFVEAVEGADWAETREIVEKLDAIPNFWDNAMKMESIRETWKRNFVRRKIKQIKVGGIPLFASVEIINAEGETVRVYKREDSFSSDDFKKAAYYYNNVTVYNGKMAFHYAEGYEKATGQKMLLSFKPDCFID